MNTEENIVDKAKVVPGYRGIYRYPSSPNYFERPTIAGKRTWRTLGTDDIDLAVMEKKRRKKEQFKSERGWCPSPYGDRQCTTVGAIIQFYLDAGCPDRQRKERPENTGKQEKANCANLLRWWKRILIRQVTSANCDRYHDWRSDNLKRSTSGDRMVDLELNTLNNAFIWALRKEATNINPFANGRPRYCTDKTTKHCREFMPKDADELHALAREFMKDVESQAIGWQLLIEACTGLRTKEALALRMDAKEGEAGHIDEKWTNLYVTRAKGQSQVMPWINITPELKIVLEAHHAWHKNLYPDGSPWYFPSRMGGKLAPYCIHRDSLNHKLYNLSEKVLGHQVTSHGLRAFYITVRRSHGLSDAQIAAEIGHTSGGATIREVYGAVPENWLRGDGPKMSFLPKDGQPAWVMQ